MEFITRRVGKPYNKPSVAYSDFQLNEPHIYISRIRVASRKEGAYRKRNPQGRRKRE